MSDANALQSKMNLDDCKQLGQVYKLLGSLWLCELDTETVARLRDLPGVDLFSSLDNVTTGEQLEELSIDYCQLLIGPRDHLPPFQSVWERGELQSEVAESVKLFTEVLNYRTETFQDAMLDHLGRQMDIMAFALQCVVAVEGNTDASREIQEVARQFFVRHLTWPMSLLAAVRQKAKTQFYAELADVTERFLRSEAEFWQPN